ncbi:uncharacterized protein LOC132736956 [Ruditapes philippinarum]|uniref:uncharacterized protein LOC132736956 n=1 Tax=Ruditapes philippinarum TaxID=129788 RepID=UPI00295C34F0|nr:uncharacterized protein LOC132736956 [Ruditapes philippinarum]
MVIFCLIIVTDRIYCYTICWDNVGKQVKARHQTRNHGNKYLSWALAYVAKNRVQSSHLIDKTVIPATAVPLEKYFLEEAEILKIKDALINSVIEILVNHVPLLSHLKTMVTEEDHKYIEESKRKSEIFNIGVLQENPSTTAGVINILDMLHRYVPQNEADGTLYPIITWGDGLSCERHADAQNARANGATPFKRGKREI